MKNRRNIVEQQNPPQNPNDIWLKDGKFYHSTSEGWTIIDSEIKYTNKEAMIADNPKGGTIGIDKESGEPSIYNDVTKQWSPLGGGLTETTWQELKDKRDAGKLTPGALYRITDYQCTTTQENTRSAGHQFDIVLLALSEDKLAEEGWAMEHPTDVYDVTFTDGITKKCWIYYTTYYNGEPTGCNIVACDTLLGIEGALPNNEIIINEESKTVTMTDEGYDSNSLDTENITYNYFQNSNLSAWKIWYCLDNAKSRFAWADDSVDEGSPSSVTLNNSKTGHVVCIRNKEEDIENFYAWTGGADIGTFWTNTLTPTIEDNVYNETGDIIASWSIVSFTPPHEGTGLPNGRGVIYRLIDEFNNDIKYDFKNIQFKRTITNGQYDEKGTETWCYTLNLWYNDMCQDASIVGNTLPDDEDYVTGVYDNVFGYATAYDSYIEGVNTFAFALGNNVVLSTFEGDYYGIYSNTTGNSFTNNTIGSCLTNNVIGNNFNSNTIGNFFCENIIANSFVSNVIGHTFQANMIGNMFIRKTIGDNVQYRNYGNDGVELATKS